MSHIVKKLSPKTVMLAYGQKVELADGEDNKQLYTLIGRVTGYETGESNYGPYTAFRGQFRALGSGQKEVVESSKAFLPDAIGEQLKAAIDEAAGPEGKEKVSIEFACNVGLQRDPNPKSKLGYTYSVENLIEPAAESDPLTRLQGQLQEAGQLSLPEPRRRGKKE